MRSSSSIRGTNPSAQTSAVKNVDITAAHLNGQSAKAWTKAQMVPAKTQNAAAGSAKIAFGLGGTLSPRMKSDAL